MSIDTVETPLIVTEFNCWKRFSERGVVRLVKLANVLMGIIWPPGPLT